LSHMAVHDTKPASRTYIIQFWWKNQEEILITTVLLEIKGKTCYYRCKRILEGLVTESIHRYIKEISAVDKSETSRDVNAF